MLEESNRRKFIAQLTTGTATLTLGSVFKFAHAKKHTDTDQENTHAFIAGPYLQALSSSQVSVHCITSQNAYTWIEYGVEDLSYKAHTVKDGLVDANTTRTHIRLKNLLPDTEYKYRVVSKEIVSFAPYKLEYGQEIASDINTFKTPAEQSESVSAIILNDIHDRPESYATLIALAKDLPYEFVILNGDLFDYQTDEQQLVDHLLKPCTKLFASQTPFILNRGNHETRGKFARDLKGYFDYPDDRYYQAFRQGPVFWIVLDTGEDKPDDTPVYAGIVDFDSYREAQAEWLENIMNSNEYKSAPFKVVVMHIPPHHSGDWHGPTHCKELFSPLFEKHNVDVVLSGHTHRHGVHEPQKDHSYYIVIGGGPKDGNRTLQYIQADESILKITMTRDDGVEIGAVTVRKS